MTKNKKNQTTQNEDGNILLIILLAIALIAALTAAMNGSTTQKAHIDDETLLLHATKIQRNASEFERGVHYIMQNGISENDIRFAHPNANDEYGDLENDTNQNDQLFSKDGGGAQYRFPPSNINNGEHWEFFGHTALPDVGSDEPELIAVLPNITQGLCEKINKMIGYDEQPKDSSTCIYEQSERFDDGRQFSSSPNTLEEDSLTKTPATQGCVQCTSDKSYHYFHVLMAR